MSFLGGADAYDRFMGRYSKQLAPGFADFAGIAPGWRVLDVGCGAGAMLDELAGRVGIDSVSAVDPSPPMVAAVRERHPGIDVHLAAAEALPFADETFDAALGQLVVHFMTDPVAGLGEMARTTRRGGVVAACVWDHADGAGPLGVFWAAAHRLDPSAEDEGGLAGTREGDLARLFRAAGMTEVEESVVTANVEHPTFDEWWDPFTLGVGPAGAYTAQLEPHDRERLRDLCREMLPPAPFTLTAHAWAVRGTVGPEAESV